MARFACTILTLNLVLLSLTSCNMLPLRRVTASLPSPSAASVSPFTLYVGLNAAVHAGAFFALRAKDGGLRWQAPVDVAGGASLGATLGEDVVYAASRDVFAIAKDNGMLLWHTPLAGLAGEPLTLVGNVLLVPRLGYTQTDASRHQVNRVAARLDAVQARTGEVVWRSLDVAGQVVSNGGIVYGRSSDLTMLLALRALDGTVLWHTALGDGRIGTPGVAGDTLYAATLTGEVVALRTSDGTIRWTVHLADRILGAVTISDGTVYAALSDALAQQGNPTNGTHNALVALRASDGTQLWRVPAGARALGTPTVASGVLYVRDGDGLSAWRATDGLLLWHVRFADVAPALACTCPQDYVVPTAPVVAQGQLFAPISIVRRVPHGAASVLVALDAQTGAMRWHYPQADTLPDLVGSFVIGA